MSGTNNNAGGVAYEVQGDLNNVKSFVSLSHDTTNISRSKNEGSGNMAGIAWNIINTNSASENLNITAEYHGVIIGTNGSHGTTYNHDRDKNGGEGQGVFALARKISSTPTNFTFDEQTRIFKIYTMSGLRRGNSVQQMRNTSCFPFPNTNA